MRRMGAACFVAIFSSALGYCQSTNSAEAARTPAAPAANAPPGDHAAAVVEKSPLGTDNKPVRIREGSKLVDQVGEFQKSGDHLNFFAKETHGALRVLPNLALERVARTLDDNPSMRVWSVTGIVTEYRGENYLLITRARASLKSPQKSAQPVEPRMSERKKAE